MVTMARNSRSADHDTRRGRLSGGKVLAYGFIAAAVFLATGDRGSTAPPPGIDPLQLLDLQVRPNAIVVLDSSGSMREVTTASGLVNGINNGELVGDDPNSKLRIAKDVIRTVVDNNKEEISFQFGRYTQTSLPVLEREERFYYATTDGAAAALQVNTAGNMPNNPPRIWRETPGHNITIGGVAYYYVVTGQFFNGQTVNTSDGTLNTGDGVVAGSGGRAQVFLRSGTTRVAFTFVGPNFVRGSGGQTCNGFDSLVGLQPCDATQIQLDTISPFLRTEVEYETDGDIVGYAEDAVNPRATYSSENVGDGNDGNGIPEVADLPTTFSTGGAVGIRAVGGTPIINSLRDIRTRYWANGSPGNYWFGQIKPRGAPYQNTFIIFVTDGDDQCGLPDTTDPLLNRRALGAAYQAQLLFDAIDTADAATTAASRVKTFFIAFGGAVGVQRSDWIAWGGSGVRFTAAELVTDNNGTAGAGDDFLRWPNNAAEIQNRRNACTTCVDSFSASDAAALTAALQAVIDQGAGTGTFSASSSVTESIFEFGALANPSPSPSPAAAFDPRNPDTRYRARVPVLLQSTLVMPNFEGHLKAFTGRDTSAPPDGISDVSVEEWDAGNRLLSAYHVEPDLAATPHRFDELHGGATPANIADATSTGAHIRRRIFTSPRNGVFNYDDFDGATFAPATVQQPVALWPPTTSGTNAVAPADDTTEGFFDDEMGIGDNSTPLLTLADLLTRFGACAGAPLPAGHACLNADPAVVLARARREARESILAFTAGARVSPTVAAPLRDASGNLMYVRRAWLLAESTQAVPAVIGPALEARPSLHAGEYTLFRDGPRNTAGQAVDGIDAGFGLRNPDKDGQENPPNATGTARPDLKPPMSVVYYAANDMLHAFRGGPCQASVCSDGKTNTGGEELWGFVPFDLLFKLPDLMRLQTRANHTYMLASSVRFADVFVPDSDGFTVEGRSQTGRWRTVITFGRGIGGKYYTTLDITTPGPYTRGALRANLPILLWSRGNPDTQDGLPASGSNENFRTNDPPGLNDVDNGKADLAEFAKMGETWSVPAIVAVPQLQNFGREFAAFVGSGYSTVSTEGKTFYALDPLTGDVLHSADVADGTGTLTPPCPDPPNTCAPPPNALVANPAAFVPSQLVFGFVGNPGTSQASRIYIGDLHGRIWKWLTGVASPTLIRFRDLGVNQPISTPVGLLSINGRPFLFAETGFDNRVDPPPNFQMWALEDQQSDTDITTDQAVTAFTRDFAGNVGTPPSSIDGFRGTAQPATAFNDQGLGRVFFIGTKFNPPGANCVSSFDSVLFALGAVSGAAVYDLDASGTVGTGDEAVKITGQRVGAVRGARGQLVLDKGLRAETAPAPPPPPGQDTSPLGGEGQVFFAGVKMATGMCR
jgi:hypothetical protein